MTPKKTLPPVRRGLDPEAARQIAADAGMSVVTTTPPASAAAAPAGARARTNMVQISMPPELAKTLKRQAVDEDTTVKALILRALAKAGYDVPTDLLSDQRRT